MTPTDTLREAVAMSVCKANHCGLTVDGQRVLCDNREALVGKFDAYNDPHFNPVCDCRASADAALSAIEAAGWRVAPVEPTDDQFHAGEDARKDHTAIYFDGSEVSSSDMVNHVYIAMLSASPKLGGI